MIAAASLQRLQVSSLGKETLIGPLALFDALYSVQLMLMLPCRCNTACQCATNCECGTACQCPHCGGESSSK